MKQNTIIILLTAAVVLLAVTLIQGRIPPTAHAGLGTHDYQIDCGGSAKFCFAVNSKGVVYVLYATRTQRVGQLN